jgi:UTP--glucose-1-phosphate uridylyltransferase
MKSQKTNPRYRTIEGREIDTNIYKISKILEKHQKSPSNLAVLSRYILTPDIFDKIDETEIGHAEKYI